MITEILEGSAKDLWHGEAHVQTEVEQIQQFSQRTQSNPLRGRHQYPASSSVYSPED